MGFEWSEIYESGIEDLDADHREILEWLGLIEAAVRGGAAPPSLQRARAGLAEFVHHHFELEERTMNAFGYPSEARLAHEASHQAFLAGLNDLPIASGANLAGELVGSQLLERLGDIASWLSAHIQNADLPLIRFLQEQRHNEL